MLTLNPSAAVSCRVSTLGPGGRHWRAWNFSTEAGSGLRLTFLTRVGAAAGRWLFRASCLMPTKKRIVVSTAATASGTTGAGPLVAQRDLRVKKVSLTAAGKGAPETGGYPDWNAEPVEVATYDWGFTSCRAGCTDPRYSKTKNGQRYYLLSERGYFCRNCTDWVAWKLQSLGVERRLWSGRGNGNGWDNSSAGVTIDKVPEMGDAAVWESGGGGAGHVAFVEEVRQVSGGWEIRVSLSSIPRIRER